MSIETAHKDCDTCNWLALDAGQSATDSGSDTWLATDADHYARYEKEIDMTTIDTTALRALAEAATPGPWEAEYSGEQGNCVLPPDARSTREAVACTRLLDAAADARFVAAFHPGTALALLDRLDEAEKDAATAEAAVQRVREMHEPIPVSECTTACSCGWWSHDDCPTVRALDGDA